MDGNGLSDAGVPIGIEASGDSNPQFVGSWNWVLAVKLDAELESTLWVGEGGITVLPRHLDEFPRVHVAGLTPYKGVNRMEVDKSVWGGIEPALVPVVSDLRAHPPEDCWYLRDGRSVGSWYVELPLGGAGKTPLGVGASEDMQSWG